MKKAVLFILAILVCAAPAYAVDFGTNITIYDGHGAMGVGVGGEDQEVEPNCQTGQKWDLEAMFLDGATLTLVGGYDFYNGALDTSRNILFTTGDIFIDVDGDAIYGQDVYTGSGDGYKTVANVYNYDYVIDLSSQSLTYDVFALNSTSLMGVYFRQNDEANPLSFIRTDNDIALASGSYTLNSNLNDSDFNNALLGGTHNAMSFDVSFLQGYTDLLFHYTYGCGNDNLIGEGSIPVPEPASMLMLGLGAFGFLRFRKK